MCLEKHEVKALRHADYIAFNCIRLEDESGELSWAVKEIIARQDARNSSTGFEQEVKIQLDGCWLTDFSPAEFRNRAVRCWSSVYNPKGYAHVRTWLGMLRQGDRLVVEWMAWTGNGHVDQAGLRQDELTVHLERGDKTYSFKIDVDVVQRGYAHGMIRPGG